MARTADEVYAEALELSEAERSKLLEKLAVADELQRRSALWRAGELTDIDSDEMFAELRARRQ